MSYKAGIVAAITELKDRTGSSSIAIKKHMQADLPKDKKWQNGMFLNALKKAVMDGDLVQTKNSYKLSADFKKKAADASKPKKATPKKMAAPKKKTTPKKKAAPKKKTATKKNAAPKKKTATKKESAKKTTPKKAESAKKTTPKKAASAKKTTPKKAAKE